MPPLAPSLSPSSASAKIGVARVFGAFALGAVALAVAFVGARSPAPQVAGARPGVALGTVAADPDAPLSLLVGGTAKLTLPLGEAAPAGALARAFFVRGSDARPWDVDLVVRPEGMVELRGPTTDPFDGAVAAALVVVVSPGPAPVPAPDKCEAPCRTIRRMVNFVRPIVPAVPAAK